MGPGTAKALSHAEPARSAPRRRQLLGAAAWSVIASGGLGVALGTRGIGLAALGGASPAQAASAPLPAPRAPHFPTVSPADAHEWHLFRRRFISAEGRVVDTGNNCITHTEGQGWGMLFAVTFDDRPTFDRLATWTQQNLSRDNDYLHRWRFDPSQPDPVSDPNNATDGDISIAWALWKAAWRWNEPRYAERARLIAADILRLLVVQAGARTVLLPGADGFQNAGAINLNLSYYCFPAMRDLAEAVPSPLWAELRDHALALIDTGRFGRWMLPPDWLSIDRADGSLAPAAGWPARFSYDAIRIPLYLAWARQWTPSVRQAFVSYWAQTMPATPAWVDLRDGAVAPYESPPGMVAVAKVATAEKELSAGRSLPSIHTSPDYYSSALILLSRIASYET